MKNPKIILAATGGVCAVLALIMATFAYLAWSDKTAAREGDDETEGLEAVLANAERLLKAKPFPGAATLRDIASNRTQLVTWCEEARRQAAAGDRVYPSTTPAAFKAFIVRDARRLRALPGAAEGCLTRKDFAFGPFKEYVVEGRMPADDKLAELQRRWDDVATVIETLAASGIAELTDIAFREVSAEAAAEAAPAGKAKANKRRKTPAKAAPKAEAKKGAPEPRAYAYTFGFTTRPDGFVKAVNQLATGSRFIVLDDFSLTRTQDALGEALGGATKAKDSSARSSRRGRRGATRARETPADQPAARSAVVVDPQTEPPVKVTLSLTVYDFRSLEDEKKEVQK